MKRLVLWVFWPSFLMAGVIEMLVFSMADPRELHGLGSDLMDLSPTAIYTLAFFCFWLVVATASALTLLLAAPEPDGSNPRRRWP